MNQKEIKNLKDLIAKSETKEALDYMQHRESFYKNEVTILSSRFQSIQYQKINDTISDQEYNRERNKINLSILELIDSPPKMHLLKRVKGYNYVIIIILIISGLFASYKSGLFLKKEEPIENLGENSEPLENPKLDNDNISFSTDYRNTQNAYFDSISNNKTKWAETFLEIIKNNTSKDDLVQNLKLESHILQTVFPLFSYDARNYVLKDFLVEENKYDFAIYCYSGVSSQRPSEIKLINFYTPKKKNGLKSLVEKIEIEIERSVVCSALKQREDLNMIIRFCPKLEIFTVISRRELLSPLDLELMNKFNSEDHYFKLVTYDYLYEQMVK